MVIMGRMEHDQEGKAMAAMQIDEERNIIDKIFLVSFEGMFAVFCF